MSRATQRGSPSSALRQRFDNRTKKIPELRQLFRKMAVSSTSQGAIIITVFFLPILTYLYFTRSQKKSSAGPLPPPTEITKIFIHPIKSCHGLTVKSARLLPTGLDLGMFPSLLALFAYNFPNIPHIGYHKQSLRRSPPGLVVVSTSDRPSHYRRENVLVSSADIEQIANGCGLPTQSTSFSPVSPSRSHHRETMTNSSSFLVRNVSKMTLIRPTYNAEKDTITVTAPAPNSMDEKLQFEIPAHPTSEWLSKNSEVVGAHIWGKETPVHAYSTDLTGPFNDFFGKEVRLVYKSPFSDSPRALASNGKKEILGRDASTCFPDLMPILVGCESSINELNTRLKVAEGITIDVRRFRPNILVRGDKPWDEDRWKTLEISPKPGSTAAKDTFTLDITQRCARCQVPNVDPETAEKHKRQPWDTLMKYRRIDEGITYKPCFGMLCVPRGSGGMLEVGMKLQVTEVTDKHRYIAGF